MIFALIKLIRSLIRPFDGSTATTQYHYNALGQIDYVEDAAGNRTTFAYDPTTGRKISETNPLNKSKTYSYNALGQISSVRGDTDYPLDYVYDSYGRMSQLKTYRDANLANPDITTWNYQESTGLLTSKIYADNKSTSYTYNSAGQLATRTWSRLDGGNPLTTSYSYALDGSLLTVNYSDSTPDVTFTYNRLGQQLTVSDAVGSRTFAYNDKLQLTGETIAGIYNRTLTQGYDALGRNNSLSLDSGYSLSYSYDSFGRHNGLTMNSQAITYGFVANSDLVGSLSRTNGINTAISYESNRDLITQVQHFNANNIATYGFNNDTLARRTSMSKTGSAFAQSDTIDYGYNDRSELVSADSQNILAYDYDFNFDPIGNRLDSSSTESGSTVSTSYTSNSLNQYSSITSTPPSTTSTPTYDFDGNMLSMKLSSGEWTATWDCENRLISLEKSDMRLEFKYDYMSRRVEKKVFTGSAGNWTPASCERYVYNGYRQIERISVDGENQTIIQRFAWSLYDQLRLIADISSSTTYSVHHDANRNVTELTAPDGSLAAHYEYAPFGGLTASSGSYADSNPFRFSSEYFDSETSLVYYNFRYYSPDLGRWLSRDYYEDYFSGEYQFVFNNALAYNDLFGLAIKEQLELTTKEQCNEWGNKKIEDHKKEITDKYGEYCKQTQESWDGCAHKLFVFSSSNTPRYSEKENYLGTEYRIIRRDSWRWRGDRNLWVNVLRINQLDYYETQYKCSVKIRFRIFCKVQMKNCKWETQSPSYFNEDYDNLFADKYHYETLHKIRCLSKIIITSIGGLQELTSTCIKPYYHHSPGSRIYFDD